MQPGSLLVNAGELLGTNINRSPTAYEANPAEERARYKHDTDKRMTQLKLVDSEGRRDLSQAHAPSLVFGASNVCTFCCFWGRYN